LPPVLNPLTMKKYAPFLVLILSWHLLPAQSYISDFSVQITEKTCNQVRATFKIGSNPFAYDLLTWYFGDGYTTNTKSLETRHNYTKRGDFTVKVDIWKDGIVKTITKDSLISLHPLEAKFDYSIDDSTRIAPVTIHCVNKTIPGDGDTIHYTWRIGNFFYKEDADTIDFTIEKPGNYSVDLEARDNLNCWSAYHFSFTVRDSIQQYEFPYITSACRDDSEYSMSEYTPAFSIINDTLFMSGVIGQNCCTEKTATYTIDNDTIFIKTWEAGQGCTCGCTFRYQIKIPGINKDLVFVDFNYKRYSVANIKEFEPTLSLPQTRVYPNPAFDQIRLQIPGAEPSGCFYEIIGADGFVMQNGNINSSGIINLNRNIVKPGLAVVRVTSPSGIFRSKIIVR
jgi:hypothetical protein